MIILTVAEKYEKIQHHFRIKTLKKKIILEETYLNTIKFIYKKPATNIILDYEKLKAFPLRSRDAYSDHICCLEVLNRAIKLEK